MVGLRGRQPTKFRQAFAVWEAGPAKRYYEHTPGRPNYVARSKTDGRDENTLGDPVFPQNQKFLSQPVLSYPLKQAVWRAVSTGESSIRQASVDFKIDIRRVAAVIRLKEIEKQWRTEGKQLAQVYSTAVMEMLPQTPLLTPPAIHEPINDLTVLPSTLPQIFWPVAESQHFTRVEAGKAFDNHLLPAEARIPHPQLYKIEKSIARGESREQASKEEWLKIQAKDVEAYTKIQNKTKKREARTTTVQTPRFEFKFEAVTVNKSSIGRFVNGIGQRYGVPPQDRKKGQIKIPTKVDG